MHTTPDRFPVGTEVRIGPRGSTLFTVIGRRNQWAWLLGGPSPTTCNVNSLRLVPPRPPTVKEAAQAVLDAYPGGGATLTAALHAMSEAIKRAGRECSKEDLEGWSDTNLEAEFRRRFGHRPNRDEPRSIIIHMILDDAHVNNTPVRK